MSSDERAALRDCFDLYWQVLLETVAPTIGVAKSATNALHPSENLGLVPDAALRELGYRRGKVVPVRQLMSALIRQAD